MRYDAIVADCFRPLSVVGRYTETFWTQKWSEGISIAHNRHRLTRDKDSEAATTSCLYHSKMYK